MFRANFRISYDRERWFIFDTLLIVLMQKEPGRLVQPLHSVRAASLNCIQTFKLANDLRSRLVYQGSIRFRWSSERSQDNDKMASANSKIIRSNKPLIAPTKKLDPMEWLCLG
ncbi:hypothetical protein TWF694_010717 [Orbilia ellipsospora]|uniref:Uncharacterized protein n=1 Tax=Orbilia ellipsospora TaxID=2528407 RepID=A0AAV9X7V6_9PEZI